MLEQLHLEAQIPLILPRKCSKAFKAQFKNGQRLWKPASRLDFLLGKSSGKKKFNFGWVYLRKWGAKATSGLHVFLAISPPLLFMETIAEITVKSLVTFLSALAVYTQLLPFFMASVLTIYLNGALWLTIFQGVDAFVWTKTVFHQITLLALWLRSSCPLLKRGHLHVPHL